MSWPPASLAARLVNARTTNGSGAKEGYSSRDGYKNLINLPPSANRIRALGRSLDGVICREPRSRTAAIGPSAKIKHNAVMTWARNLRANRNIGDFRRWKNHVAYSKSLDRVIRDLSIKPKE
jgi:hypothetical protein